MEREKRNTNIKYIKYNKPGWDKETGANYIYGPKALASLRFSTPKPFPSAAI